MTRDFSPLIEWVLTGVQRLLTVYIFTWDSGSSWGRWCRIWRIVIILVITTPYWRSSCTFWGCHRVCWGCCYTSISSSFIRFWYLQNTGIGSISCCTILSVPILVPVIQVVGIMFIFIIVIPSVLLYWGIGLIVGQISCGVAWCRSYMTSPMLVLILLLLLRWLCCCWTMIGVGSTSA